MAPPPPATLSFSTSDPQALLCQLQSLELTSATHNLSHPHPAAHLLCLLFTEHLCEARFLWRRLPATCKQDPTTTAVWALVKALWQDKPAQFFAATAFVWPPALVPLVDKLIEKTRGKMLEAVRKGYDVISVERMAAMLGMDRDSVVRSATSMGWLVEGAYVQVIADGMVRRGPMEGAGAVELQTLTEQLVRLQTSA